MIKLNNYYHPTLSKNRALIIVTIMLVAILEVLDGTIVNVALPHMMPALGANTQEITWVLTSYIVASAMMLPLTGIISNRIGHRRLLLINITGFMLSSFFCGSASSLLSMIIFRSLQGAFGAALIPLSQAILRENFALSEQGKAMAIWGIGIMAAPVFGPTLGGFIVEHSNWRWIFYLNTPVCLLGLILTLLVIKPSEQQSLHKIDWISIVLMFLGIGTLQLFLDQGDNKDWFNSNLIIVLLGISVIGLSTFIARCVKQKNPIIKLSIFMDRNFSVATLILSLFCACFFPLITLEPLMLQTLFNYTAISSGKIMAPIGIFSAIGMVLSSQLINRINIKYLLTCGLATGSFGGFLLAHININAAAQNFMLANIFLGLGMGLFMVPLTTCALATVARHDITEASGLFSYGRMLGTSIGISLFGTLLSRMTQVNWNQLGAIITPFNPNVQHWLSQQHLSLRDPHAVAQLQSVVAEQARLLAFTDAFMLIAVIVLLLIPLIFSMQTVQFAQPNANGADLS